MATLSKERREWLTAVFGEQIGQDIIRLAEAEKSQKAADELVSYLKEKVNSSQRDKSAANHPGLSYFGTAFKSMKSQRPTPTLADLQQKAKALSADIKQQADAMKTASETDAENPDSFWTVTKL